MIEAQPRATVTKTGPTKEVKAIANEILSLTRDTKAIFPRLGSQGRSYSRALADVLMKAEKIKPNSDDASNQGVSLGLKGHPFDMDAVREFMQSNEHHSTCLETKVAALVGLGHKLDKAQNPGTGKPQIPAGPVQAAIAKVTGQDPSAVDPTGDTANVRPATDRLLSKADQVLDPLCKGGTWAQVISAVAEDYANLGAGCIEVVREQGDNGAILGLHHLQTHTARKYVENELYDFHWEIQSDEGSGGTRRFAAFGDSAAFASRFGATKSAAADRTTVSEVIYIPRPNSRSRWYGFPDWLAAVPTIELNQALMQHKYDFFINRGVPEFMLFILGAKLDPEDWKKVETALKANIGSGNSHKSLALNVSDPDVQVQLEKLAMEAIGDDNFSTNKDAMAMSIVTAHRVPPLLAGILIPGKLGATNELINAMQAFQALVIGPGQRNIQQVLGATLGNPEKNGGLDLKVSDLEFHTILDEINASASMPGVQQADTVSRMRQSPTAAAKQGRDLGKGLKA